MEFFFDAFKRVFELVLSIEIFENFTFLSLALIIVTVWSVFRFLVFPLFTRETMDTIIDKGYGAYVDSKRNSRVVGFTNNKKGKK